MWKEFKEFIAQGNVLDLAVAVVIGTAFQQIVSALVDNIIMPFIGVVLGGVDFTTLIVQFGDAEIEYGMFIQAIVDFLIVAAAIFVFVKVATRLIRKKQEEEIEEEPPVSEQYLKEIRDLLQQQSPKVEAQLDESEEHLSEEKNEGRKKKE